eukprot:TRINITY_DN13108_c0_g1_i4.p2 TRINITY_DN13108_c0_g1~~TRINITY_DN13108_c0_g1_i4.p2  ORF type:complete len:107 (+),score=14.58 TRINITY_DN13108_c0_g1_i4:85-405(+)
MCIRDSSIVMEEESTQIPTRNRKRISTAIPRAKQIKEEKKRTNVRQDLEERKCSKPSSSKRDQSMNSSFISSKLPAKMKKVLKPKSIKSYQSDESEEKVPVFKSWK